MIYDLKLNFNLILIKITRYVRTFIIKIKKYLEIHLFLLLNKIKELRDLFLLL
jgi:hypothetical protein